MFTKRGRAEGQRTFPRIFLMRFLLTTPDECAAVSSERAVVIFSGWISTGPGPARRRLLNLSSPIRGGNDDSAGSGGIGTSLSSDMFRRLRAVVMNVGNPSMRANIFRSA